jgi:hypothetical protein
LKGYFDFIEFAIENTEPPAAFNNEQIAEMWKQFVIAPSCVEERNLFFAYLMKTRDDPRAGYFLIVIPVKFIPVK